MYVCMLFHKLVLTRKKLSKQKEALKNASQYRKKYSKATRIVVQANSVSLLLYFFDSLLVLMLNLSLVFLFNHLDFSAQKTLTQTPRYFKGK